MLKNEYYVIGVMSGTSLDGVDLAYIQFSRERQWRFKIICAETISYSSYWQKNLTELVYLNLKELQKLDGEYTVYLSELINDFIRNYDINELDAVCSHGHTALHQPDKGITYQIGNLPELATMVNTLVVCDFRVEDVKLGGQGAPLVPIGDKLLFSDYDYCLNLGGFANISEDVKGKRLAYDICPVNIVLNNLVNHLGKAYDDKGEIARTGTMNEGLLRKLNSLPYYRQPKPKSLGLEWVREEIFPILQLSELSWQDKLRTFIEHIADQISYGLKSDAKMLVTGGGAYNSFLFETIKSKTSVTLIIPDKNIIEFKEALIFGLLGVLRLRNKVNILQSVTGASKDHCGGKVYNP